MSYGIMDKIGFEDRQIFSVSPLCAKRLDKLLKLLASISLFVKGN